MSPEPRPERRKTRRAATTAAPAPTAGVDDDGTDEREQVFGAAVGPATDHSSVIAAARRRGGMAGGVLGGAMLGLRDVLEGPKKEQIAIVVDAPTEPVDLDEEGIHLDFEETSVAAPPLPPLAPRKTKMRRPLTRG